MSASQPDTPSATAGTAPPDAPRDASAHRSPEPTPEPPPTRRVARWLQRLSHSDKALWVLFWASFAETIVVPIPIEVILIPFMVTNRGRLWLIAGVVTLGCLAASIVGYGIGYFFFDTLGRTAIDAMGWGEGMERFRELFAEWGFWAVIAVGIIPIPFQVAMLAAGAAAYPIVWLAIAASLARGLRYFGLAALVWAVGDKAEAFWHEHRTSAAIAATVLVVLVIGGMILL